MPGFPVHRVACLCGVVDNGLCDFVLIGTVQPHPDGVHPTVTLVALVLRGADERAVLAVDDLHVVQSKAGKVEGECNHLVTEEATAADGRPLDVQLGAVVILRGGNGRTILVESSHNIVSLLQFLGGVNDVQLVDDGIKQFVCFGLRVVHLRKKVNDCGQFVVDVLHGSVPPSTENPTTEELLADGVSVCRVQCRGLEMVVVDRRNEMVLSFQLCFHLGHGLVFMTAGVPRGTVRKAVSCALFECRDWNGVKAAHTRHDVRKVFVLVVHQPVNVLGGVLIEQNIGHVCRDTATGSAGIRHCLPLLSGRRPALRRPVSRPALRRPVSRPALRRPVSRPSLRACCAGRSMRSRWERRRTSQKG
nr:MAG TPA: hypothetical protein [Caudoviricetes sp.]